MQNQVANRRKPNTDANTNIDYFKFIIKIVRSWYWMVASLLLALGIAYLVNFLTTPQYRVKSSIVLGDEDTYTGDLRTQMTGGLDFSPERSGQKIIGTLKSYMINDLTLQKLEFEVSYYKLKKKGLIKEKVYNSAPFKVIPDSGANNIVNVPIHIDILSASEYRIIIDEFDIDQNLRFGDLFSNDYFRFRLLLTEEALKRLNKYRIESYFFVFNNHNALVNELKQKLIISYSSYTNSILNIALEGENTHEMADYLNMLCDVYVAHRIDEKNRTASNTVNYIESQLEYIGEARKAAEDSLQRFRIQNINRNFQPTTDEVLQSISGYQQEKSELILTQKYLNYLNDYLINNYDDEDFILPSFLGIQQGLIESLVGKINELFTKKERYRDLVKEKSPSKILLNKELEALKSSIIENIDANRKALDFSISIVDEKIFKAREQLNILPDTERQFLKLQKSFQFNDNIYNLLLQKRLEANLAMASTVSDSEVLERAKPENAARISPKKTENYNIAAILGLIFPILIIVIKELSSNKITDINQIIGKTELPVIARLGHGKVAQKLPMEGNRNDLFSEALRTMRSKLYYIAPEEEMKVLGFTSAESGEGKTFCSANFGAILASTNKKVLLIGLDLRRPKLKEIFDISNEHGISTYLIGKYKLNEVIQPTGIENYDVISSGPVPPNPVEMLEMEKLENTINDLKKRYDYIIIDTPPVGLVADGFIINKFVDINFFVIRMNFTKKQIVKLVEEYKAENILKRLNIVINDIRTTNLYGKYYYSRYYYYSSRYYYNETDTKRTRKRKKKKN
jgi:tyrosine-protein kinase Etk/Wzc